MAVEIKSFYASTVEATIGEARDWLNSHPNVEIIAMSQSHYRFEVQEQFTITFLYKEKKGE
jgi:hypothetical protein